MMNDKDASTEALQALGDYLKSQIPELTVLNEWPDPKKQLNLPTLSIIAVGEREYNDEMPSIFRKVPNTENPDLIDVAYTVGSMDYRVQLDLWTDYPKLRTVYLQKLKNALNGQFVNGDASAGLSLTVTNYFDLIARFDRGSYTYPDSEESSQRSEWRVKVDLMANHSDLLVKTESKMRNIQIVTEVSDDKKVEEENISIQETNEI